jgi:hypothetical protein
VLLNYRLTMGANENGNVGLARPRGGMRPRTLVISGFLLLCGAFVAIAVEHEVRPRAVPAAVDAGESQPSLPLFQKALTPAEEDYAAALWEIHKEVKVSAVEMSFAGIQYKIGAISLHDLDAKIRPLANTFSVDEFRVRALVPPDSLRPTHDLYVESVSLYQKASEEVLKTIADGQDQHLIAGQAMGERAAENLLTIGDKLWPGEYKPN